MAVFIGTFENKVDKKGRLSVPSPFRHALSTQETPGIIVFPSRRANALEGCGMDLMEQLVGDQSQDDLLNDSAQDDPASIFYALQHVPFDGDGRVILPLGLRQEAGIEDAATFVGIGKRFQIWAPDRLAAYKEKRGAGGAA